MDRFGRAMPVASSGGVELVGTSRITASVHNGDVTHTGTIQYETQRHAIVKAAGAVPDVAGRSTS
jgi:hypothetical protein